MKISNFMYVEGKTTEAYVTVTDGIWFWKTQKRVKISKSEAYHHWKWHGTDQYTPGRVVESLEQNYKYRMKIKKEQNNEG